MYDDDNGLDSDCGSRKSKKSKGSTTPKTSSISSVPTPPATNTNDAGKFTVQPYYCYLLNPDIWWSDLKTLQ